MIDEKKWGKTVGRIMQSIEVSSQVHDGVPHVRLTQNTNSIHLHPSQLDLVMQWLDEVRGEIDNRMESI